MKSIKTTVHHIGLLIWDEEFFINLFSMLGYKITSKGFHEEYGVSTFFLSDNSNMFELVVPKSNEQLRKTLIKNGNQIHHIAFEVEDMDSSIAAYRDAGYDFLSEKPLCGHEDRRVIFLDPLASKGILIELMEAQK